MTTNRLSAQPRMWGALLMATLLSCSCLNNSSTDCVPSSDCISVQPTVAQMTVQVTNNSENPAVPIAVYLGDVNDSVLYFNDTLTTSVSYDVPLDQRYSATAKYRQGDVTILAIDGSRTKLKSNTDCGTTCYDVTNALLNLKLRK